MHPHYRDNKKENKKKEEKENGGVHDIKEMAMTQTIHCIFGKWEETDEMREGWLKWRKLKWLQ